MARNKSKRYKLNEWTVRSNRGTISAFEQIVLWKSSMRRDFSNFESNTIYARFMYDSIYISIDRSIREIDSANNSYDRRIKQIELILISIWTDYHSPIFKSNRPPLIQFSKWIFHLIMLLLLLIIFLSHSFHSFNYEIFTNE